MNYKRKKKKMKKWKQNDNELLFPYTTLLNKKSRDFNDNQKLITKITCLNARTLSEIRLTTILDYINKNGIDIMGLMETNKPDYEIKYMNVNKYGYKFISHNDNRNPKGKGVMLIIKEDLERHIYNITKYEGRVLSIDFCFKKNKKLRIILVYNISGNKYANRMRVDINNQIIKKIKKAKNNQMELIVFGDFNLQYKKYQEKKTRDFY